MGRPVEVDDFAKASRAAALLRKFAELKTVWPYRRKGAPGPCNYFFENGEYPRPPVQRWGRAIPLSRYEDIFRELDSAFFSAKDLHKAEAFWDHLFNRLKAAIISAGIVAKKIEVVGRY